MRMRDVMDVVTSEPPPLRHSVDDIVASGERSQRRRRLTRAVAGTASVVVTLGVAAAVIVPSLSEKGEDTARDNVGTVGAPAAGPAAPFTFTFGPYKVGRLQVAAPISVSTTYELAPVYSDGLRTDDKPVDPSTETPGRDKTDPNYRPDPNAQKRLFAYLAVYRPGAFDASKLTGVTKVTVGGRDAYELADTSGNWKMTRVLAWQHADGAWAVIDSRSDDTSNPSADELRKLAAGLRTDARTPARSPVKLGYVPAGYGLTEVGVHATTGLNGISSARAGDHAGLLYSNPPQPTTGLTGPYGSDEGGNPKGAFAIFVVPTANSNQQTPTPGVSCLVGFCNRWFGDTQVQVSSEGLLSNTEMTRILEGVTLSNVQDDTTWSPVA